jgi:Zn-dependent metalloprotease
VADLIVTEQLRGRRNIVGGLSTMFPSLNRLYRSIFDAKNGQNLPGDLVKAEGGGAKKGGTAVDEAYDYSGDTYEFFSKIFERKSIDNKGMRLDSTVHYGENYNNAFWNGNQMVYGDGDGEMFNRFTISLDVIGHELAHGITQYEAALEYQGQPGALSESFSDVLGSLEKQHTLKQSGGKAIG